MVEQIPAKIVPDVIKNTALKVMHRLPARDDREAVGATIEPDRSSPRLSSRSPPGVAAVTVDGADRPLLVQVPLGEAREADGVCDTIPPLTGRRSPLCGKNCLGQACDLRELNEARALAEIPALTMWTEAVTAAMVLGSVPRAAQARPGIMARPAARPRLRARHRRRPRGRRPTSVPAAVDRRRRLLRQAA